MGQNDGFDISRLVPDLLHNPFAPNSFIQSMRTMLGLTASKMRRSELTVSCLSENASCIENALDTCVFAISYYDVMERKWSPPFYCNSRTFK